VTTSQGKRPWFSSQREHITGNPSLDGRADVEKIQLEEELAFRLIAVRAVRARERDRIRELAASVDQRSLARWLSRERLLVLAGSRLFDVAGDAVGPELAAQVESARREAMPRYLLGAYRSREFCRLMEGAGIRALSLKGPLLAERAHADPTLRAPSVDLDFLVAPTQLDRAVRLFRGLGYEVEDDSIWTNGLPHYHYALRSRAPGYPRIELHWRIHWHEYEYTQRVLDRSTVARDGVRWPTPADDLAMLLIIYARDGFLGLRFPADIGAWWDAAGEVVGPGGLDPILTENPGLRPALMAGLRVARDVVGLPSERLALSHWRSSRRASYAPTLLNWRRRGTLAQIRLNVMLVDLLLSPPAALPVFLRHYYFQPVSKYVRDYGWRPERVILNRWRRRLHALARLVKSVRGFSSALVSLRRHGTIDPLPARA